MKKSALIVLVVMLALLLATSAWAKTVIKLANAGPNNPDNRTVKAVEIFKAMVEAGTKGEIEVRAYHASSLGSEREALEGIRMGTVQMGTLASGPVPGFFKPAMVYDIPFMFTSAPAAWEFFESDFAKKFGEEFRKASGVRILATTENGFRHFTDNTRPMKSPADMKGLKIRTMENPAHMAMVKALGADPTPIAFGELYMALQQKVVDGMECPVVLIHDMKFYEVQKYMVLDGHLYGPLFIFINDKFFSGLTPEQQKVVAEAAKVLAAAHNGFSQQANIEGINKLKAKGMEIYAPTKAEMGQFRSVAQPAGLEFIKQQAGEQWVKEALAAAAAAEAKVGDKADAIVADYIKQAQAKSAEIKK
ncbi:MAG: DctP family TRAP transporter solute-binding subunit [Pseudomonadota bacterium]